MVVGGEAAIGAAGAVGQPAKVDSTPIRVAKMTVVKTEASATKDGTLQKENQPNTTPQNEKKAEGAKKDEKGQSKEQFEQERGFVDGFAINLIKNAKLKAVSNNGSEALELRKDILEQRRQTLVNKLSLGGQIDIQDKELLGMLEYQFPPKNIIAKEGFNPIFEPRVSLTHLLDYYNQVDPTTIAEKGAPTLTPERRKQITEAATHLGLITSDGENGKFAQTTMNIVKDIFKDSSLSEDNFAGIVASSEKAIEGRLILTPKDFDPESGFLGEIGTGIKAIQNKILIEEHAGIDTKDSMKEVGTLIDNKDVFMGYITEAVKEIGGDYQKLTKLQLNEKEMVDWFNIFGPQVVGVDQTVAINKYFGKHNLMDTLKKNRIMTLAKGSGVVMSLMSILTAYGMYQTINKKEGAMG